MKTAKTSKKFDCARCNVLLKKHGPGIVANLFRYVFFLSLSYVLLYPFIYILVNSFMGITDSYDATVTWVPKNPTLEHFPNAWTVFEVGKSLPRTLIYEMVTSIIQFVTCAVAAYGMARFKFRGQGVLNGLMILNILVPAMMIIIPTYAQFSAMNLVGTPLVFYLPGICGVGLKGGLYIYIYTQFFRGLPKELEEAAWIDGAGPIGTYVRIILPSSGVAILTVTILSIIWHWNEYYLTALYFNENQPMAVVLSGIMEQIKLRGGGNINSPTGVAMASCILFMLPVLIMYLILQKKFIKSIDSVGIVG